MFNRIHTPGIPLWLTLFALLSFVMSMVFAVSAAFMGQTFEGMDAALQSLIGISWGGRHVGVGLCLGLAVGLRSPTAYLAAFLIGIGRDVSDLIIFADKPNGAAGVLMGIVVLLAVDIFGALVANKARTRLTRL